MRLKRRIYYAFVKPIVPRKIRIALRKSHAKRILANSKKIWPIDEKAGHKPKNWKGWPRGADFGFFLTHDVETGIGLSRIQEIASLEMRYGFRSSFNFIPEGNYQVKPEVIEWLTSKGFEVGVHDLHHNGKLFCSKTRFYASAAIINHYLDEWQAVGFRGGFMLRELDWLFALKIKYDATTFDTDPFEPQPEGAGTIFPFRRTCLHSGSSYTELPYTLAQDSTLFIILGKNCIDLWKRKLEWLCMKGGMVLVNVHPDYAGQCFDEMQFPISLYEEFLAYVSMAYKNRYWHSIPKNIEID